MEYRQVLWLTPILLLIHNFEEYLTMPVFIVRHGQDLPAFINNITSWSRDQLGLALIIVTLMAFLFTYWGSIGEAKGTGMFLATTTQTVLLINGVQHIAASVWFRTYTPGVLTAIVFYLPLLSYIILRALKEGCISGKLLIYSFILGAAMILPIILLIKWAAHLILYGL